MRFARLGQVVGDLTRELVWEVLILTQPVDELLVVFQIVHRQVIAEQSEERLVLQEVLIGQELARHRIDLRCVETESSARDTCPDVDEHLWVMNLVPSMRTSCLLLVDLLVEQLSECRIVILELEDVDITIVRPSLRVDADTEWDLIKLELLADTHIFLALRVNEVHVTQDVPRGFPDTFINVDPLRKVNIGHKAVAEVLLTTKIVLIKEASVLVTDLVDGFEEHAG